MSQSCVVNGGMERVDEVWDAFIRTSPRERGSYDGMGEGDHLSGEI